MKGTRFGVDKMERGGGGGEGVVFHNPLIKNYHHYNLDWLLHLSSARLSTWCLWRFFWGWLVACLAQFTQLLTG